MKTTITRDDTINTTISLRGWEIALRSEKKEAAKSEREVTIANISTGELKEYKITITTQISEIK